jgi:hypothetical protein
MLNDYLPNRLLREELIKRDYVLSQVDMDDNWKGGTLKVPFKGAGATSVKFGGLTAASDISTAVFVKGTITGYTECWGSLIFEQRDLMEHDGKIPESTFLRVLPDIIEDFMEYMKQVISVQLVGKSEFATVSDATNAATGIMIVDHIDRFQIGQKCILDDNDSATVAVYVIAIDVNVSSVTLSATRGGSALDVSAYTVAQAAKFYHDGVWDGSTLTTFTSLRKVFLSLANGGDTNVHGLSKLAYPYLQAVNVSGSTITATNILDKIFDAYTTISIKAKGSAKEVLMSFKHLGSVMKIIEVQKGAFKVSPGSVKASEYGWTEIEITSVTGRTLKFVGIQEMDDDVILFVDWKTMTFRTNGGIRKRKSPNGLEYFEIRNVTGYQYVIDSCLFGELEVRKPGQNGIIFGISY